MIDVGFHIVVGRVLIDGLRSRSMFDVEVKVASHAELFPAFAEGAVDVIADAWLPDGHGEYWAEFGKDGVELGDVYPNARFYWAINSAAPRNITSIADLASAPSSVSRTIRSVGASSASTLRSQAALDAYALDGYRIDVVDEAEWLADFDSTDPAIIAGWTPSWPETTRPIRTLDEEAVLGATSSGVVVARHAWMQNLSDEATTEIRRVVESVKLSSGEVAAMDLAARLAKQR